MTELLLGWLRKDLELDVPTTSFETLFASGYYFGNILYRTNQQQNFPDFIKSDSADAKIVNFCLLEPTLRSLQIKFEATDAAAIMNEKKGAAIKLLYQIKMAIETRARSGVVGSSNQETALVRIHNLSFRSSKPTYDQRKHSLFEKSIRLHVQSSSSLLQKRKKLEAAKTKQYSVEKLEFQEKVDTMRLERIYQKRKALASSKPWEEADKLKWRENLRRRRTIERQSQNFQRSQELKKIERQERRIERQKHEMKSGIDEFEETLEQLQEYQKEIPHDHSITLSRRLSTGTGFETAEELHQRLTTELQDREIAGDLPKKTLEQMTMKAKARSQIEGARARRRTKFLNYSLVQQEQHREQAKNEALKRQLLRTSEVEQKLDNDLEVVQNYFQIAAENREYVQEQYSKRAARDTFEAISRDVVNLDIINAVFNDDVQAQNDRYGRLRQSIRYAQSKQVLSICKTLINDIVELTLDTTVYREKSIYFRDSKDFLVLGQWKDLKQAFVHQLACNAEAEEYVETLTKCEVESFFAGLSQSTEYRSLESCNTVSRATTVNVIDQALPPSYVLGEFIKHIRLIHSPLPSRAPVPDLPKYDLQIILIGRPYTGRHTQADLLARHYNLKVLSVHDLLHAGINDPQSRIGQQASKYLQQGEEIPDNIYVSLITEAIRQLPKASTSLLDLEHVAEVLLPEQVGFNGWILCDFPKSLRQAQLLETALTGFDRDAHVPNLNDKSSPLCQSLLDPIEPLIGRSGIDKVYHIRLGRVDIYNRCLGRFHDTKTQCVYNIHTSPPSNEATISHRLQQSDDAFTSIHTLSLHTAIHDSNVEEIQQWYEKFNNFDSIDADNASADELHQNLRQAIDHYLDQNKQQRIQEQKHQEEVRVAALEEANLDDMRENELRTCIVDAEEAVTIAQDALAEGEAAKLKKEEVAVLQAALTTAQEHLEACVASLTTYRETLQQREACRNRQPRLLDEKVAHHLLNVWDTMEKQYQTLVFETNKAMRQEHVRIGKQLTDATEEFGRFFRRLDTKQALVSQFQLAFNDIPHDMRFLDTTKAELHLRTDELVDKLAAVIAQETEATTQKISKWKEVAWDAHAHEVFECNYILLFQAECDKVFTSVIVLVDATANLVAYWDEETQSRLPALTSLDGDPNDRVWLPPNLFAQLEELKEPVSGKASKGKAPPNEHLRELPPIEQAAAIASAYISELQQLLEAKVKFVARESVRPDEMAVDEVIIQNYTQAMECIFHQTSSRLQDVIETSKTACSDISVLYERFTASLGEAWEIRKNAEFSRLRVFREIVGEAIVNETNLPYLIQFNVSDNPRFPPLAAIESDFMILKEADYRVVPPEPKVVHPVVEYQDEAYFSERQLNHIGAALREAAGCWSLSSDTIPQYLFIEILSRLASNTSDMPTQWQQLTQEQYHKLANHFDKRGLNQIRIVDVLWAFQAKHLVDELLTMLATLK